MSQNKLTEAPHIAYNDKNFGTIDFQVEKMPISQDEKKKIAKAFTGKGIIGRMPNTGKLLRFTQDSVKVIKNVPKNSTMLPNDWNKYAVIIRDDRRSKVKEAEQKFRNILRKMIKEVMAEKWEPEVDIKSTGEHADKTIVQLKKEIEALKGKPGNKEKMGELLFALRAKQGWKKGEGATGLSKGD